MYKFISTLLLLFSLSGVQAEGIQFRDMSLPEAQVAAGKEGKLVFVDCYTPSCGPCKFMARHIFPMDSCGEYMNPRFVSVMKDLEAEGNTYIAKKYNVHIYPTFLILRTDGSLYAKLEGGAVKYAGKFLNRVDGALALGEMEERYTAGDRGVDLLTAYVDALMHPAPMKARSIINDYVVTLSVDDMACDANLELIKRLGDAECDGYIHMVDNRAGVASKIGKKRFGSVLDAIYVSYSRRLKMMGRSPSEKAVALREQLRSEGYID